MLKSIFGYFFRNKTLINMILIFILIIGVVSAFKIKQEVFPTTSLDMMIVKAIYPGASPKDVELNALIPIEDKLKGISGIDSYDSIAVENGANVIIYIDSDVSDTQKVKDEITRQLNQISSFPSDMEDLIIVDANPKLIPVYTLGINIKKGSKATRGDLYHFVDQLEDKLLKLDGVSSISKEGYAEPEIKIYVNPKKAGEQYISLNEVVNSIKAENVRATGGTLQSLSKNQTIVTIGEFENPLDVGKVIIRSSYEGKRVVINDIAKVKKGFKDMDVDVRVNRQPGVTLSIIKKESADIIKTTKAIKNYLKKARKHFPADYQISLMHDMSLSIESLLKVVKSNAVIGFVLVFLFLMIFLDLKSAFWTAFSIPTVVLMMLGYMNITHMSLNIISLGALITVMGMLVDDGIVISENIYSYRLLGMSNKDAILKGTSEVAAPILVSGFTTIAAFLPMLFISGRMGKMISTFPIIISMTLIFSLLEAFFILPNHLSHGKEAKPRKDWFAPVEKGYKWLLERILKYRGLVIAAFVVILIFTGFLFKDGLKHFQLMSDKSADQILINITAKEGSPRLETTRIASQIEGIVFDHTTDKERISVQTSIGKKDTSHFKSQGYRDYWAQIGLNLVPVTERKRSANQIMADLQKALNAHSFKNVEKIEVLKTRKGPDVGKAVEIKISGHNLAKIYETKDKIRASLSAISGVENIVDDTDSVENELLIRFNKEKMARLGIKVSAVAQTVRMAYHGSVATSIQKTDHQLDFRVEMDPKFQMNRAMLGSLTVPNKQGRFVRLDSIAWFEETNAVTTIHHYNGERTVTVSADVDSDVTSSKEVMKKLIIKYATLLGGFNDVNIQFGGEMKATIEAMKDLAIAFGIALIGIYFMLVLLFKSVAQPLLIMTMIPFGFTGAFLGFMIHGMPMSFMGAVGMIGLAGVIVNDNVVMVDMINNILRSNPNPVSGDVLKAVVDGAGKRLRPILLTTFTTVFGLLPTVYGFGGSSDMIIPIVTALAYGLLFDSILTLFFMPSIYLVWSGFRKKKVLVIE